MRVLVVIGAMARQVIRKNAGAIAYPAGIETLNAESVISVCPC